MIDSSDIKQLLKEAWTKRGEEKYDEAQFLVKKAHGLCNENDFNSLGRTFNVYMQFESDQDNYLKAVELSQISLNYYKKANNLDRIAHSKIHIADLQNQLGKDTDSC